MPENFENLKSESREEETRDKEGKELFNEYGELKEDPEEEDTLKLWEHEVESLEEVLKEIEEPFIEYLEEIESGEIFYDTKEKRFPETQEEIEEMKNIAIKNHQETVEELRAKLEQAKKKVEEHKEALK